MSVMNRVSEYRDDGRMSASSIRCVIGNTGAVSGRFLPSVEVQWKVDQCPDVELVVTDIEGGEDVGELVGHWMDSLEIWRSRAASCIIYPWTS
jgi:hypothetical protein